MKRTTLLTALVTAVLGWQATLPQPEQVTTFCACSIYVPNVFSPNNDNTNDTFRPFFGTECKFSNYSLKILDRWGNIVFETTSPEDAWDGRVRDELPQADNYVYLLVYTIDDNGKVRTKTDSGNLTLIL